jgi:hypothetical protein
MNYKAFCIKSITTILKDTVLLVVLTEQIQLSFQNLKDY